MLCRKTTVFPIEAIVRGYLVGSGWKEYQAKSTLAGEPLPPGIPMAGRLLPAQFTPSTKAESGHDVNISVTEMTKTIGGYATQRIMDQAIGMYNRAASYARSRGVIIADTKFEFGYTYISEDSNQEDKLIWLIDEALTPDSSRFWDADTYEPGKDQPSFDKQFVRDFCSSVGFNGDGEPPTLPLSVVRQTREKYIEAFKRLTRTDPVL
jgi:phosphoribosylaminoimidazole-succinocarboxamide synthase